MAADQVPVRTTAADGWALGLAFFAGCMMVIIAIFQVVAGIAALASDDFYQRTPHYVFAATITMWGWTHLVLGIVIGFAAAGVFAGVGPARAIGMLVAVLGAVANFLDLPHRPLWSLVLIVLDVAVVWALAMYTRPYRLSGPPPAPGDAAR
ncbi:hypothetical protein GCM10022419_115410 [Nonomuraea rosea]|uniref:DUF7144 domain-containing protein n=1 Tax=Nonomuraea rosea TaxID=638574 RepID=A0ABP6ZJI3_9ACTN